METQEMLKNNQLIAVFMGWEEMTHTQRNDWMLSEIIDGVKCAKKQCSLSKMKFSTSWNWLMPVVEKIQNDSILSFTIEMDAVRAICFDSEIKSYRNGELVGFRSLINNHFKLITCIYQVVIETIQWYNTKNQQRETQ